MYRNKCRQPLVPRRLPSTRTAIRVGALLLAASLYLGTGMASSSTAYGQNIPWRVVRSPDGALYLLRDGVRHRIEPAPISEEEIRDFAEREPLQRGELPSISLSSRGMLPGTIVALKGTPHLWVADSSGVLHWASDLRALIGHQVEWSRKIDAQLSDIGEAPRGEPWLSAPLLRKDGLLYLPHWDTNSAAPRLMHVPSLVDVALIGISQANYADLVLDAPEWEKMVGLNPALLSTGTFTPIRATPTLLADPNPVMAGQSLGTTTILWHTGQSGELGQVYVSVDGAEETLIAEGAEGSAVVPWIALNHTYDFQLYLRGTESAATLRVQPR
jgi:hypothetical protein